MPRNVALSVVLAAFILAAAPSFGAIWYTTYGGGQQIWMTADSFVARSTDGGSPNFVSSPAAAASGNTMSGSAFFFDSPSLFTELKDWWVQYEIPKSVLPSSFNLSGAWTFWGRVSRAPGTDVNEYQYDSDYLLNNGDPNDLDMANPTDADWFARVGASDATQKVFNFMNATPYIDYNFGWVSNTTGAGATDLRQKTFKLYNDKVTFRLYEREAGHWNPQVDLICWSNNSTYVPTDADYQNVAGAPHVNLIRNGDFSLNDLSYWVVANNVSWSGASRTPGDGTGSAVIPDAWQGYIDQQYINLAANTDYKLTWWTQGTTGTLTHSVQVQGMGGSWPVIFEITELAGATWTQHTATFNSGAGGYVHVVFGRTGATGEYYQLDDVDLTALPTNLSSSTGVKSAAEGAIVRLADKTVTASLRGAAGRIGFAVEEIDRSSGVRVISTKTVNPGDNVTIEGVVANVNGERVIDATLGSVVVNSSGNTIPKAVAMANSRSAGGSSGGQGAVVDKAAAGQMSAGLNNVGLLAKIYGKVTASGGSGWDGYFYVDDGSGLDDGSGNIGIKCRVPGVGSSFGSRPPVDDYVVVTGIIGVQQIAEVNARFIWTTEVTDLTRTNLITNGSFSSDLSGWLVSNNPTWSSEDHTGDGSGSCLIPDAWQGYIDQQYIYLEPGTNYQLTWWTIGSNDTITQWTQVQSFLDWSVLVEITEPAGSVWTQHTATFNSGDGGYHHFVFGRTGATGDYWLLDDVSLYAIAP